ncbi:DeoR/GlpR family DNA-binding transcription regulator [Amaricoccus tamworthensis]|uniref:DeoR/GlpR family DNA-binding transcription regulator n=1 Tax=Amaricoccus tamworthensis TaxID=57002 RepID=UPI003C7CA9FB
MDLNIPDTRQRILGERLGNGREVVAVEVAAEFGVSVDTIRRDILALEAAGLAHRVRGGAVPVAVPSSPLLSRMASGERISPALVAAAVERIGTAATILADGGVTVLSVISKLPKQEGRLVVTPSPWVAVACHERGIEVFLLGGRLNPSGGIATGDPAVLAAARISADVALLGACGLEAEFGLSSDEFEEAQVMLAMHRASRRSFVVTDGSKIGRRARHGTLAIDEIDLVITDAEEALTRPLVQAGTEVIGV